MLAPLGGVLLLVGAAHGYSARTWLAGGQQPPPFVGASLRTGELLELPLVVLPSTVLLPGERHEAVLAEEDAASINAIKHAQTHHSSCCGLLLVSGDGQLPRVTPLLEVERIPAAPGDGGEMRVRFSCVGRVQLASIVRQPENEDDFVIAGVEPYIDEEEDMLEEEAEIDSALSSALSGANEGPPLADEDAKDRAARAVAASAEAAGVSPESVVQAAKALLANLDREIAKSYGNVLQMRSRLSEEGAESGTAADTASLDERVKRACSSSVDELTLVDLWGASDRRVVERQLFSFLAAASAGPNVRMHALLTSSTTERLSASLCALREEERRLAAMCALRGVGGAD